MRAVRRVIARIAAAASAAAGFRFAAYICAGPRDEMTSGDSLPIKPTGTGMRRLFVLSCMLVGIMGLPLFVWPTETERNFAWTIRPAVTAAFMGAAYWGSFFVVLLALREKIWAHARIGLPFAVAFAWIVLGATVAHIDRFHFGAEFSPAARFMTWTWLAVYVAVPVLQLALIVDLHRRPGSGPPIEAPLPGWYRLATGALGGALILLGLAIVVAPVATGDAVWPWKLTPLTGRMTGAWLVAWGVVTAQVAFEGDGRRARPGCAGLIALALLQIVVLARFGSELSWHDARTWAFALVAIALLAVGAFGSTRERRTGSGAPEFRYVDRWRIAGRIEEVAEILRDAPGYARWWRSVYLDVRVIERGDERHIGEVGRVRAKGWLPYVIEFDARVVDERFPHGFKVVAEGELSGRGEWTIDQNGPWVDITYEWAVLGNKPIFRYLSFLLRPVFEGNHNWTMRRGEEGLRLELARRQARTPEARARIPEPRAPVARTPWAVAGALLEVLGLAGPGTPLRVEHTTVIRRPVAEVFAYVARVENDRAWQPEIAEVRLTSPGPIRVGSTFREVRRTLGRTFVWDMRVTALETNRHLCIESAAGTMPYRGCRQFEAIGDGTRITETSEVELPVWLRPFRALIARSSARPVASAYENLKGMLETPAAPVSGARVGAG